MKQISLLATLFFTFQMHAQKKFIAVYEHGIKLNWAKTIHVDSSSDNHEQIREAMKDSATFTDMFNSIIGEYIKFNITVTATDSYNNTITAEASKENTVHLHFDDYEENFPFLKNGKWVKKNDLTNELITLVGQPYEIKFTGNKKLFSGYECEEVKASRDNSVKAIMWICTKLPSSINPAIQIKNVQGAVMAFASIDERIIYMLMELKEE